MILFIIKSWYDINKTEFLMNQSEFWCVYKWNRKIITHIYNPVQIYELIEMNPPRRTIGVCQFAMILIKQILIQPNWIPMGSQMKSKKI